MSASWQKQAASDFGERPQSGFGDRRVDSRVPAAAVRERPRLAATVDLAVVPRLLLTLRRPPPRDDPERWQPGVNAVRDLADRVVSDGAAGDACVARARAEGAGTEALYLDLLAPAAMRLGTMWDADTLSFADVTIGMMRLHRILGALGAEFRGEVSRERPGRRVLLVPAPGEQHNFGLAMVADFFRRSGWAVWAGRPMNGADLVRLVRHEWFGVIGFSCGSGQRLELLAAYIRKVRAASSNRAIGVMVGGPVFSADPSLAASVGADATAQDGRHAAFQAEGLLAMQPARD